MVSGSLAYDVFLSHSSVNKPWVETLALNLRDQGLRVFYDAWDLVPGRDLNQQLEDALHSARSGVLVVSPEAYQSGWVRDEWSAMLTRQKGDPDFSFVAVVYGDIADFPFLNNRLWVDFRDAERYRRSFHELLCGLQGRAPGDGVFEGSLQMPKAPAQASLDAGVEQVFDDLFEEFYQNPIQMLLAQDGMASGPVAGPLLARARLRFGSDNVHHVSLPVEEGGDTAAYFSWLGRKLGLDAPVNSIVELEQGLSERLHTNTPLFLLLSGFESTPRAVQRGLASVVRGLVDGNGLRSRLLVLFQGGERLADLRFAEGNLSLLNTARVCFWPEPGVADLQRLHAERFSAESPPAAELAALLRISGGHPRLIQLCLEVQTGQGNQDHNAYEVAFLDSPEVWAMFTPLVRDDSEAEQVREWLEVLDLGPARPYDFDGLRRRLFWRNLLARRCVEGRWRLQWRCELLRRVGREVLSCT